MITKPYLFYFVPEESLFFLSELLLKKKKFKTVLPYIPNPKWERQTAYMAEKVTYTRF